MVQDVNDNYITALGKVWPANRLGPNGDPKKVYCTTCHRGVNKPMGGVPMLKDYPALMGPYVAAPGPVEAAPVVVAATPAAVASAAPAVGAAAAPVVGG